MIIWGYWALVQTMLNIVIAVMCKDVVGTTFLSMCAFPAALLLAGKIRERRARRYARR